MIHLYNLQLLIEELGVRDFRDNPLYIIYYLNWTRFTTTVIIPMAGKSYLLPIYIYIYIYINRCLIGWFEFLVCFILFSSALVYFNTSIFRGIQMSHERTRRRNTQRASEMNLAAILLCIVVIFSICHFPRILLNVHELTMVDTMIECDKGMTL